MEIINLTGHPLMLGTGERNKRFRSKGRVRVEASYTEVERVDLGDGITVPILIAGNGDTFSLPEPEEGTLIVVSGIVAGRVRRQDVVAPARLHRVDSKVQYARALMRYKGE